MSDSRAKQIAITGMGLISAWGEDPSDYWSRLVAGETAYGPVDDLGEPGEKELLKARVAAKVELDPRARFPGRNIRPVDRTGRLAIAAAEGALSSADWSREQLDEHLVGLALGTLFGSMQTISAFDRRGLEAGPKYVKPLDFANSVINAAAGQTAIWHGLRGTNSTVAGGAPAALQAIGKARDLLRMGRADAMLAGGAEELCFESFYGFQQAGHLCEGESARARPFDSGADGLVLAEGSALLMLESVDSARERGVEIRGLVLGHGTAFDTSRGKDQLKASLAVERAVRAALNDAELEPGEIDVVFAGSGGRPKADRAEASGLISVFAGRNGSGPVPVTAIKSSLGDSLGAASAFQTAALVLAMEHGFVPGTTGLKEPAATPGDGTMSFLRESQPAEIRAGLVTAMGLDGNATALVVGRPDEASA